MDPFGGKNPFGSFERGFSEEYFEDIRKMVDRYTNILNDDFWNSVNGMERKIKEQSFSRIPIEIWESDDQLFILAFVPSISKTKQVKAIINAPDQMTIEANLSPLQPPNATNRLFSELTHQKMTRQIQLPCEVDQNNHQVYVEKGLAIFSLNKDENQLDISFNN